MSKTTKNSDKWNALKIAVLGGDDREQEIARLAATTGATVTAYGFPWPESGVTGAALAASAKECLRHANFCLMPIPGIAMDGSIFANENIIPREDLLSVMADDAHIVLGKADEGLANAAKKLGIHATIYMPLTTPGQKTERVRALGGTQVDIEMVGDVFDDAEREAVRRTEADGSIYVHPFDDPIVIEGQGTLGMEMLDDAGDAIDIMFLPVGGGGLAAGVGSWVKAKSPKTEIIGVQPEGAPSMVEAFRAGHPVRLKTIDAFTDGAAVQQVGALTYEICREVLDEVVTVPEGRLCATILRLYNDHGIIVEPAGALAISALEDFRDHVKGKTVACLISGGNNDFRRIEEIRERALIYEGVKHYFIVRFPQRAGALREFVVDVLGPSDDITHFAYSKKTDRERGPAVVGVELRNKEDLEPLIRRMKDRGFFGEYLNDRPDLLHYLV